MSYYDPCTGVGRAVVAAAVPGGRARDPRRWERGRRKSPVW